MEARLSLEVLDGTPIWAKKTQMGIPSSFKLRPDLRLDDLPIF